MKPLSTKTASLSSFDYAAHEIGSDTKERLEASASHIHSLGRKSTEQAFELGKHFADASDILPEKTFGKWAGTCCGMTERHARNFRAVHRSLAPYRSTLVELGVNSTVLFRLTAETEDQIQAAIDLCKEAGSIKVKDVQAIMAIGTDNKSASPVEPADVGGVDGLKAMIVAKVREGIRLFLMHIAEIETKITAALSGKRVVKSTLAAEIVLVARLAKAELKSLALFVQPGGFDPSVVWDTTFPKESCWAQVWDILHTMAGIDSWPEASHLRSWLEVKVLPALEWATSKTKSPAWPDPAAVTETRDSDVTAASEVGKTATKSIQSVKRAQTEQAVNEAFGFGSRAGGRKAAVAKVKVEAAPPLAPADAHDDDKTLGFFGDHGVETYIETRDFPQLSAEDFISDNVH